MSLLRRLAEGMKLIGQKIMMMNQVYLEDTEIIPITDEEFVEIRRENLVGNFDLICDIASAQMDDLRSQDPRGDGYTTDDNVDYYYGSLTFSWRPWTWFKTKMNALWWKYISWRIDQPEAGLPPSRWHP